MQTELNGRPQAMIAMSGGVDSSVAAYLMQQAGYDYYTLEKVDEG